MLTSVLIFSLFSLFQGPPIYVEVRSLTTPKVREMATYQAIAVAGFVGSYGEQVTSAVEAAVRGSSIKGYRAIRVIPRNDVSTTLRGRTITLDTALEVGLKHRADAVVFGEITQSTSASKSSNKTETKCISNENESNTLKKLFSCKQTRNVIVQCTERAATFRVFASMA